MEKLVHTKRSKLSARLLKIFILFFHSYHTVASLFQHIRATVAAITMYIIENFKE